MPASSPIRSHPDGAILTVWVVPGAKRTEVVGLHGDALRVRVAAAPERGKANRAVVALLEKALGCRLRLAAGAGSRRKRLIAVGLTPLDLTSRVERLAK